MKVYIVGGPKSIVNGSLQSSLGINGIFISGHTDMNETYHGMPRNIDGVIILKDLIGHSMKNSVAKDIASRKLKCCYTTSKWATARTDLIKSGFIAEAIAVPIPAPIVNKPAAAMWSVIQPMSENTKPQVQNEVTDGEILDIIQWTLSNDYEMVVSPRDLHTNVQTSFPDIAGRVTLDMVNLVCSKIRTKWSTDRDARNSAAHHWMVSKFNRFKKDGTNWVTTEDRRIKMYKIFGFWPTNEDLVKARTESIGSWATVLERTQQALDKFNDKYPDFTPKPTAHDVERWIAGGKVPCVKLAKGHFTSADAIAGFLITKPTPLKVTPRLMDIPENPVIHLNPDGPVTKDVVFVPDVGFLPFPVAKLPVPNTQPQDGFVATAPAQVHESPQNVFDPVSLANLIESGVAIQVAKLTDVITSGFSTNELAVADLLATVSNLATTVQKLSAQISVMADEIKVLRDQPKQDVANTKALHLGNAIMSARGADIHLTIGDVKQGAR